MSFWGYKIPKPDPMDLKTLERVDHARWGGGEILWDDIEPATPEVLAAEAAESERWRREWGEACDKWLAGECCGLTDHVSGVGFCRAACGGCYRHPNGEKLARDEWAGIDRGEPGDHMSPWNRWAHFVRLSKEMKGQVYVEAIEERLESDGIEPKRARGEVSGHAGEESRDAV